MKKIIISISLALTMLISSAVYAKDIMVIINGEQLVTDTAPQLVNERTMLPMRAVFEALGADVTWIGEDELIVVTNNDCMIVMKIGSNILSLQKIMDDKPIIIELDAAPYIFNERTMIPVRAVAEALNAAVDWNGDTSVVTITKQ